MAKRPDLNSDFSQKLLGDIRRRKEKLGFSSSSNNVSSSNPQTGSQNSFRGGREGTKNNYLSSQSNNKSILKPNNNTGISSPRRNHKQGITPKTPSQEMVPYRKDQKPVRDKIDVSMALALALSKTGKLQNIELMSRTKIGTEFVTRRGSIQFLDSNRKFVSNGNERNGKQYLLLPNFGIEKLNEMINAYTRNRNFRDLEECLNMLIMVQDAQDCMAGSKRNNTNKILLIKDKEEKENKSRNKLNNKHNKLEKNGLNSHGRSVNCGANTKQENNLLAIINNGNYDKYNCKYSNNVNSERNKKRIPGLVARLMGLEELPQPVKSKVEIKEVELDIGNEIFNEKEVKVRENIERIITSKEKVNFMAPPSKCETRLERITRNYMVINRGFSEKSAKNGGKNQEKKIEEKAQTRRVVRDEKLIAKPSVDLKSRNKDSKKNSTIAQKKSADKLEYGDNNLKKKSFIHKKKEIRNDKASENGCKRSEKITKLDQNLKEIRRKIEEKFEFKLEDSAENRTQKDVSSDLVKFDRSINTETNFRDIISTDIDANHIIRVQSLQEHELQLHDLTDNPTGIDSCNYTSESTNLDSVEDVLTKDQNLLREILLQDTQFLDFAQKIFKFELPLHTIQSIEITVTPMEKETNTPLLHTVNEILERKFKRHDLVCMNFKLESLNSLIRELDSDLMCLEYKFECETLKNSQKIIEREIEVRNPDSNCMWGFGWNSKYSAQFEKIEIAKDLEKHLVSGLITELTKDLIEEII